MTVNSSQDEGLTPEISMKDVVDENHLSPTVTVASNLNSNEEKLHHQKSSGNDDTSPETSTSTLIPCLTVDVTTSTYSNSQILKDTSSSSNILIESNTIKVEEPIPQPEQLSSTKEVNLEDPVKSLSLLSYTSASKSSVAPPLPCSICGKSLVELGKAMVRFLPTSTSQSDISLHVFCGKTASILPTISQPQHEISLKAGLKNKHGIGPDINFALARTRSTVAQGGEAEKDLRRLEKEYYLVQEFEENLASLRKSNPNHGSKGHVLGASSGKFSKTKRPFPNEGCNPATENSSKFRGKKPQKVQKMKQNKMKAQSHVQYPKHHLQVQQSQQEWTFVHDHVALTNQVNLHSQTMAAKMMLTNDSRQDKITCPCGGAYWPTCTAKGRSSWKAHAQTKRHIKWNLTSTGPSNSVIVGNN